MRMRMTRVWVTVAAAAALNTMGITETTAAAPARQQPRAPSAVAVPGAQLWVQHYPGGGAARSVAVSPAGDRVFVTGESAGATSGNDYTTVAYNAATGAQVWARQYNGPGNGTDEPRSVAVSPAGDRVFVTGSSYGGTASGYDYATVAYSAATGARQWAKRYNSGSTSDDASALAVSRDGSKVFVTGTGDGVPTPDGNTVGQDYVTVAYSASTGARLWVKRYNGPANGADWANSVAVGPGGGKVFVTGSSYGGATRGMSYATVAYNAATGAQLWAKRYGSSPRAGSTSGNSVAVSPAGGTVFVTGTSEATSGTTYETIAYSATTGTRLWAARYQGGYDPHGVAVSPAGDKVFVTGEASGAGSGYATVAYSAATGTRLWAARYLGGGYDSWARSVAASPARDIVYVTGGAIGQESTGDTYTLAYNASTGTQLWAQCYPCNDTHAEAFSVAVSPRGDRVFIAGDTMYGYTTVAFSG